MSIDAKFEKISQYENDEMVVIPTRKTAASAGYDFYAAETTIIPSYRHMIECFPDAILERTLTFEETEDIFKKYKKKVTLVPTGIKCKLPKGYFLQLSARSSLPLKHWLIVANGVGIIDADYYNNSDNEGHIYFQLINLAPWDIVIEKGDCFGQGIILPYETTSDDDNNDVIRSGGLGSTSES